MENALPLPALDNAIAVRNAVARVINDVHSRKLDPKIGVGLTPLLGLLARIIAMADHEQSLVELEKLAAKLNTKGKD